MQITRAEVEDFLYLEAELIDDWKLIEWSELFTEDGAYYVPTIGKPNSDHKNSLFLIADDKHRLVGRAQRLLKKEAHVEFPHSTTRHLVSNVRIKEIIDDVIYVQANFVAYRTKREVLDTFVGHNKYQLVKDDNGNLKIKEKRVILDLDSLRPQGKLSILL